MSMFVDGVRETARDCVANPAESQWKLLILNGQWWWPETLPNTRSRTRMRTLHSPKMGIKCRIFRDRSRTFTRSCPQRCPHRSTVAGTVGIVDTALEIYHSLRKRTVVSAFPIRLQPDFCSPGHRRFTGAIAVRSTWQTTCCFPTGNMRSFLWETNR